MSISREYLDYLMDQLRPFGAVSFRRMFGGAGLYHQGLFFGLVADDVLYFKVNDSNRQDYVNAGAGPFKPFGEKSYEMSYSEVPGEVLEDPDELARWARKAFEAARENKAGRKKGRPAKKTVKKAKPRPS